MRTRSSAARLSRRVRIEVDGVAEDRSVLVEAWAHQGSPKSAQKMKVMNDAFKLIAASRLFEPAIPRLILLFADEDAARPFQSNSWRASALAALGIEVVVAELPADVRDSIVAAQRRQFR